MRRRCVTRVTRLLHRPLSADAAVQIALLNNLGLQAAYNRLGIAEALAVKASRPPCLELCLLRCLDAGRARHRAANHRQPAVARDHAGAHQDRRRSVRSKPSFAPRRRPCASRPRRGAPICARSRRAQIVAALGEAKANAEASAELAGQLKQTGAVNKLDQARREVFATEIDAELVGARQQAAAAREKLTRLMGLWQSDLDAYLPSALAGVAGLDAKRQGDRAGGAQRPRRRANGAARDGGDGEVLWAYAQDALPQCARRRRHLQDAEGPRREARRRRRLRARARSAAVRFRQGQCARGRAALSRSRQSPRPARRECGARRRARPMAPTAPPMPSPENTRPRCCPCTRPSRRRPSCNTTPCRSTPSRCSKRRGSRLRAKVAGIEAKRNFWLASTDLSVAMLGGGNIASEPDAVIAATSSGNECRVDKDEAS